MIQEVFAQEAELYEALQDGTVTQDIFVQHQRHNRMVCASLNTWSTWLPENQEEGVHGILQ
jgi:hypothetical protein